MMSMWRSKGIQSHLTVNTDTYQGYDKWFFEAKAACDGEDWVETGEHGSKENDLPNAWVDGKVGKMVAEGSKLLLSS